MPTVCSGSVYTPSGPRGPLNTGLFTELYKLPLDISNELKVTVKASNDAEILLYDECQDKDTIKICLGSSYNHTCSIEYYDNPIQAKKYPQVVVKTGKVLNPLEFKTFILKWNYGVIQVFHDGDKIPFLTWRGPSYLRFGNFGVRTSEAHGVWTIQGGPEFDTPDTNDDKAPFVHGKVNSGKIEFEVRTSSDAIFVLTALSVKYHNPAATPSANFLIGNWSNNRTALYLNRAQVCLYDKTAILSAFEYRRFWIKWDSMTIQMGEYGDDKPKMFYTSPAPLDEMNYFGYMTGLANAVVNGYWRIYEETPEIQPGDDKEAETPAAAGTEVKVFTTNTRYGFFKMDDLTKNCTPVQKLMAPDNIYHGGVSAFGIAVDFIKESGINEKEESEYFKESPLWVDSTFYTTKSKDEFFEWVELQKQTQFTDKNYDLIDNNCLTFTSKACKFLGGREPQKVASQRAFVIMNRDNPEFMKAIANPPPQPAAN